VKTSVKRVLIGVPLVLLALIGIAIATNWDLFQRLFMGGVKIYETTPPTLPAEIKRPAILVFSKTNGFRHGDSIPVATAMFADLAKGNGWGIFQTENGAAFSPEVLARFDAVVFNNVSGDVFTPEQRAALKAFLENGGGFVGVHASGGDFSYKWDWYVNDLIGTQFIGHPMNPQFQKATVKIEDKAHPATKHLPESWSRVDEWYSFEKSVRRPGYNVLATLDESTYSPKAMFGSDIRMGKDHPIAWWHCVGKGRALYSALGHTPESYREPEYRQMLNGAILWALRLEGEGCGTSAPAAIAK
jgi:type 1 glutamine amidotransferase